MTPMTTYDLLASERPRRGEARRRRSHDVLHSVDSSPVPQLLLSDGQIAQGWRVVSPIPIYMQLDEDNSIVLSDDMFGVYGVGDTLQAAQQDYIVSLIDQYHFFVSDAERGNRPAKDALARLRAYLRPIEEEQP